MKKTMLMFCIAVLMCAPAGAALPAQADAAAETTTPFKMPVPKKPLIQMAILLDTSNSMDGLIDQAKAELWAIVNEFIFARRDGKVPELQVALYEYGKSTLSDRDGFIRMITPLTTDLDKISEELFALKTKGGDEYCGWVIQQAVKNLKWSQAPDDLKVIFIAGNERFTQGHVKYENSCKAAISKGIVVNTIHCGSNSDGISGKWKDGALLADGRFLNIDQNRKTVHIESPYDGQITDLNAKLNDTYIPYGRAGKSARARQLQQDRNALSIAPANATQRAATKSSSYYRNDAWDLVDALKHNTTKLDDLKNKDLPEPMRKMTNEQRQAYVQEKAKQREEIQHQIQQLNSQRKKYVAGEMKKRSGQTETLGSAIIQAVRQQATKRNFNFHEPEESSDNKNK